MWTVLKSLRKASKPFLLANAANAEFATVERWEALNGCAASFLHHAQSGDYLDHGL